MADSADGTYTFSINPCKALSSIPTNTVCPSGTNVCQMTKASNSPAYLVANQISNLTYDDTGKSNLPVSRPPSLVFGGWATTD